MHFEILIEDASGKIAVGHFLDQILGPDGDPHTRRLIAYKGIGSLPKNLGSEADPRKKILLDKLPSLLRAYGQTFAAYGPDYHAAVIVICDLDRRDRLSFSEELNLVLNSCEPKPKAAFQFAVEEGEAWLLGDRGAVLSAYPKARIAILDGYVQDSICGTWEALAEAVHPGGASTLKAIGFPGTGIAKCEWAGNIAPLVSITGNISPSFQEFVATIQLFVEEREIEGADSAEEQ